MPTHLREVVKNFARSANNYEHHAEVQLQSAGRLSAYMEANTRDLVPGPVLEIGCGTGILSRKMLEILPDRQFHFTDACAEMVHQCAAGLTHSYGSPLITNGIGEPCSPAGRDATASAQLCCAENVPPVVKLPLTIDKSLPDNIQLRTADAEQIFEPDTYALIAAAFALQWLGDLEHCLGNLTQSLKPGGKLFFSVPTAGSFPEWKNTCRAAGVTFTGNSLPEASTFRQFASRSSLRFALYEETFVVQYRSLLHFLQSLKLLGAGTATHTNRLNVREMRRLLELGAKEHPESFPVTYKILFGHFTRMEQK